jgi:hypothetical protein
MSANAEDHSIAAALLVQTVFNADERLRTLLREHTVTKDKQQDAEATANFLKPWQEAMLKMVGNAKP